MDNHITDQIEEYLSGNLEAGARIQFEQQMAANPELAARVALERSVMEALDSNSAENRLRSNLNAISSRFPDPQSLETPSDSGAAKRRWWWLGLVALAGLASFPFLMPHKTTQLPNSLPEPQQQPLLPSSEQKPVAPAPEQESKPRQPIAAAFKPIPRLESYVGTHTRSNDYSVGLQTPQNDAAFKAGKFRLPIAGKMEGAIPEGAAFKVMIFNNDVAAFEAMKPLATFSLSLDAQNNFRAERQMELPAGLYYILIEETESGEWPYAGRFLLK